MSAQTTDSSKPVVPSKRDEVGATATNIADLLKNAEQGLRITGLVLLVEEPRRVQGKSAKGNPYDFWMLGIQIWTGNKAVQCGFRGDSLDALPKIEAGGKESFKIESGRVRDGQLVFDLVCPN